ncbi:MAG: hypothetical protein WAZ15_03065, partial [Propioniciclava sp.]
MKVLVVDGANVVGSVPDGWWRDRAGAAARLHAGLQNADLSFDWVVLVLEGSARAGVPEGEAGGVTTVHAPGEGDDEVVAQCRDHTASGDAVTVASAYRGLLSRLDPLGVTTLGPRA